MEISGDKFRRNAFCIPGYATSMCILFIFNARRMQLHASLGGCCVQITLENTATLVSERSLAFDVLLYISPVIKGDVNYVLRLALTCNYLCHWR